MAKLLQALLRLQTVERNLSQVRRRLKTRQAAVDIQQQKIDQLQRDYDALNERSMNRRKDADRVDLDIKTRDAQVTKLRSALNAAKTNKEYAAILTEINTTKADNSKLEDEYLKIVQEADALKADTLKILEQIEKERQRLSEIQQTSSQEIARLDAMVADLNTKRAQAAGEVPPEALVVFERVSKTYDGEAMALIESQGRKPPFDYICGGCFMSLRAEHANVLRVREEIRTCDNCRRILYMEHHAELAAQQTKAE